MISINDNMSMIFEPMDLEAASHMVSQNGVAEPHRMGWETMC